MDVVSGDVDVDDALSVGVVIFYFCCLCFEFVEDEVVEEIKFGINLAADLKGLGLHRLAEFCGHLHMQVAYPRST